MCYQCHTPLRLEMNALLFLSLHSLLLEIFISGHSSHLVSPQFLYIDKDTPSSCASGLSPGRKSWKIKSYNLTTHHHWWVFNGIQDFSLRCYPQQASLLQARTNGFWPSSWPVLRRPLQCTAIVYLCNVCFTDGNRMLPLGKESPMNPKVFSGGRN